MEEPPFFDEDAALADYMDDYPPEPDPEDEFAAYEMMQQQSDGSDKTNANTDGSNSIPATTEDTAMQDVPEEDDAVMETSGGNNNDDTATASSTQVTPEKPEDDGVPTDDPHASVEEYLAARKQENQLFSFQRYKKGSEWRAPLASSDANTQQQAQKKRKFALGLQRHKQNATAAPDAQFLDLLQYRGTGSNRKMNSKHSNQPMSLRQPWKTPRQNVETMPMTLADGTRVYLKRNGGKEDANSTTTTSKLHSSCTLGVTMKDLLRRVDNIKRRQIHIKNQLQRTGASESSKYSNLDSTLWVDKHAPSSFPQLLSEERTNREVLRALRRWDPYVFGKAPMPERKSMYNGSNQNNQSNQYTSARPDSKDNGDGTATNPNDKRPAENARVILLSGPPGVGKTTLAHIVARHAGYRPLEVNASDDRSASVLTERIQRAMESTTLHLGTSVNSKGKGKGTMPTINDHGKPNCLILDEIDGADARGAIQALADIIKAEIPAKNAKQKQTYLRRPIICICNHKYAPALRPLLPYAVHFNVEPPSSARLVARLKTILNKEKLNMMAGGSLLHQLVVSTGGDIRSCLFTLQFAAAEGSSGNDLSQALMNSLNGTGLKDDRNDVASTITTVFRKVKSTAYSSPSKTSLRLNRGDHASTARVMDAVEGFGDDSAAINALFVNVLRVSYIDPAFDRCSAAHELLSGADVKHGAGYSMQRINTPPIAAGIHLLCRVEVKPKLSFSTRELADSQYRQEANQALVQKFCEGLPVKASNFKCRDLLSKEFVPMVLWILSAGEGVAALNRPASSIDLLSKAEREVAEYHVAILRALGLTYIQDAEKEATGGATSHFRDAIAMKLEPPIHRLVQYRGSSNILRRKEIPANMKALLAQQVRLENFRSQEKSRMVEARDEKTEVAPSKMDEAVDAPSPQAKEGKADAPKVTPRKMDHLASSATLPEAKRAKPSPAATAGNFLGIAAKKGKAAKSARRAAALGLAGPAASSSKQKLAHTGSGFQLNQVVRMKYVKGFTQAVRTPCRLQDFE